MWEHMRGCCLLKTISLWSSGEPRVCFVGRRFCFLFHSSSFLHFPSLFMSHFCVSSRVNVNETAAQILRQPPTGNTLFTWIMHDGKWEVEVSAIRASSSWMKCLTFPPSFFLFFQFKVFVFVLTSFDQNRLYKAHILPSRHHFSALIIYIPASSMRGAEIAV